MISQNITTQVYDLTPLAELEHLEELDIRETLVSDQQVQALQQALPNCDIQFERETAR